MMQLKLTIYSSTGLNEKSIADLYYEKVCHCLFCLWHDSTGAWPPSSRAWDSISVGPGFRILLTRIMS